MSEFFSKTKSYVNVNRGGGQKNLKLKKYKVLFVLIFIYFLCGVGVTYAYFAFREENTSVIVGNVVNVDADLSVELVVGNNDGLVPMTDAALSNAINGVGSDNGACVDSLGNLSCQVYKITLTNNGSRLQHLKGTIKLNSGTSDEDLYVNLRWQELTDTTTVKTDSVVNNMSKSILVSDLTLESKETKEWYVAVWLSETDYDQTYSDTGEFGGVVTFETFESIEIDGELNEYGFYYDKLYEMEMDGQTMAYAFHEDGSASMYVDGTLTETTETGFATYDLGIITINGTVGSVSSDGTSIYVADEGLTMNLEGLEVSTAVDSIQFEKFYSTLGMDTARGYVAYSFKFYENELVDFYYDDVLLETASVSYNYDTVSFTLSSLGDLVFKITNDGGTIEEDERFECTFILGDGKIAAGDYWYYWVGNGWHAQTIDTTKSSYENFREELSGYSIVDLDYAFQNCENLIVPPEIPSTVTKMDGIFSGCTNLITAPEIKSSVINMSYAFEYCINLEGEIEINANPTNYDDAFKNTIKPITITGSSTEETKANLAGTANNGNVSY